ncbi:MAG: hypothetical protein HY315_01825 [Acidobacteria bacterium]|nr:hypothetical protein [Acidobacteriota bacterium]
MSEKDSIRESFIAFHKRLEESVELFHSLRQENSQLRTQVDALEAQMKSLAVAHSRSEGEVAKLLDERKLVRDRVEKILQVLSLLQSKTLG